MKTKIFLLVTIIVLGLLSYFSFDYLYSKATEDILNQRVESSKMQAQIISNMLAVKLENNYTEEQVKLEFQKSIENMPTDGDFVCMFNSDGEEICHPNKNKVGLVLDENNSVIKSIYDQNIEENFKRAILEQKSVGGLREMNNRTEVVYLEPVKGAEWLVASHSNIENIQSVLVVLKERLFFVFLIIWIGCALLIFLFLNYYNTRDNSKIVEINKSIEKRYFEELNQLKLEKSTPKRISLLAEKGSKLVPVIMDNIAVIYSENKVTHILEKDGKRSTIGLSLDNLIQILDADLFYRTSRQTILSILAIEKIEKFGQFQLKIITSPQTPIEIIVSKAKLSDFKIWAGKN